MKKYLLLLALVCLLGNRVLAQNYQKVGEINFAGLSENYNGQNQGIVWSGNTLSSVQGYTTPYIDVNDANGSRRVSLRADETNRWRIGTSGEIGGTYFQMQDQSGWKSINIDNLKQGDKIILKTNPTKECGIWTNNTSLGNQYRFTTTNDNPSIEFTVTSDGSVQLQCIDRYSGIHKIELYVDPNYVPPVINRFDYDPGYEEYDMYDEFSANDRKKCIGQDGNNGTPYTYYTTSDADFQLNGQTAQYITLSNSKITANNRIAIDRSGTWRFNYGLRPPSDNGGLSYFSICNLREGDRVVFSYTTSNDGQAPIFASAGNNTYNGCKAFADKNNDGVYHEGEDTYITAGASPITDWTRGEGAIGGEDNNCNNTDVTLYYTQAYVITEDGHLDIAMKNAVGSRIVKIKIYSDHQASMIDEYDNHNYTYTSKFDITGELQAKEHIVPGGLEVHVGSDDPNQHAHVISSEGGPESIVNGVRGFKLPGMSLDNNDNLKFEFNIGKQVDGKYIVPSTGTFYRFIVLEAGKITLKYQGTSMNYYTYGLDGDAVYYGHSNSYTDDSGWTDKFDRPNEQTVETTNNENNHCPYYLMKSTDGGVTFTLVDTHYVPNGKYDTFEVTNAAKNDIYYVFGGWNATDLFFNGSGQGQNNLEYFPYGAGNGGAKKACGVAELLWVKFQPNNRIYPLAKWVPNGTTDVDGNNYILNPDDLTTKEWELANVEGYVGAKITIKKMSGNITGCTPSIVRETPTSNKGKLIINGITYNGEKNKGGTILIKIGDETDRYSPVYTLTVAYSADAEYDDDNADGSRGHTWDFSSKSLSALQWNSPYDENGAEPIDYGTYFADYFGEINDNFKETEDVLNTLTKTTSGLLHDEMTNGNTDWMFNYNLKYDDHLYDPVFLNKYDIEADNADMLWDTEGTVIKAFSNRSCIFNEFKGTNTHTSEIDPNRFVGILRGSEFRIPWLMKNDRVIIWMAPGKGRYADEAKFSITHAYDALHNPISPDDEYIVGGSQWTIGGSYTGNNGNDYRGCYHFFATGDPQNADKPADMVFKLTGGELCKIYKIQIYRGDRIITNEIKGATADDKFLLWSRAKDPNDANDVEAIGPTYNWTLKYFGKDQKLADGKKADGTTGGVNNDIVAWTGAGISTKTLTTSDETDPTAATYNTFTFQHDYNTIGTFRARGKDMEKNMKYVADYGEHNVTVAHQQTMKYPYTWDLMDMTGWSNNATRFINEDAYGSLAYKPRPEWFDSDDQWNASYEKNSTDLSLFGKAVGNDQGYVLRLNSQETASAYPQDNIFESVQTLENNEPYYGNQLWTDGRIVPESQGLWFHTLDQNTLNGSMRVYNDGMTVGGNDEWRYNMVVPNVPKDAAVYMRIKKASDYGRKASYKFAGSDASELTLLPTEKDDEYIVAIKNDKGAKKHLTLSLAGYQMKKLSVSTDPKKLNIRGWATESRDHVIDPELTAYLTGKDIETCVVTGVGYADKTITLTRVYSRPSNTAGEETTTPAYVMSSLANGDKGASILHNKAVTSLTATDGEIKILDGGFHLFVPDMHDYDKANDADGDKTITDNNSMLVARVTKTTSDDKIPGSSGNYTNYALTYKHFKLDDDGNQVSGSSIVEGTEAFYRIAATGASSSGNQGYLPLETKYVDPSSKSYGTNPSTNNNGGNAKFSIIFEDEFENINPGITTTIDDIESSGRVVTSEGFYNLNGQKINGIPTQKGMYIVNGKKVLVK